MIPFVGFQIRCFQFPGKRVASIIFMAEIHSSGEKSRRTIGPVVGVAVVLIVAILGIRLLISSSRVKVDERTRETVAAKPQLERPPAVSQAYVGSAVCRECHAQIWELYKSHPMAQTLSEIGSAEEIEDSARQTAFSRGNREYRVERSDGKVVHHELQRDARGDVIYDQGVEIRYAIGSGRHGRSYLIDRDGRLFASSISWYSQPGRWDLSPGYESEGHKRFERPVVDRCVACHAGRSAPDPHWVDRFQKPAILEFGIGCERCHGPGADHVAHRRSAGAGDDPIVNPTALAVALRESVCNQCHLHGDEELLRYGRTDFDFRPGMHVGDVWSVLVSESDESMATASQVQQMRSSACYKKSGGQLGCVSCHDPHSVPARSDRDQFYRRRCLACHQETDCDEPVSRRLVTTPADSCIVCHMPQFLASDLVHLAQTEHRVPKIPATEDAKRRVASRQGQRDLVLFDAANAPLSELEWARLQGVLLAREAESSGSLEGARRTQQLLAPVVAAAADDRVSIDAFAVALALQDDLASAKGYWQHLAQLSPLRESTLLSLATVCEMQNEPQQTLAFLDRLVDANPGNEHFRLFRSRLYVALGRSQEAVAEARRAVEINPSAPEYFRQLAIALRAAGLERDAAQAEQTGARLAGELQRERSTGPQ